MKKILCLLLLFCLVVPAYAAQTDIANSVVDAFLAGDFQKIESMLSDEVRASIGAEQLEQAWNMQLQALGEFIDIAAIQTEQGTEMLTLRHENGAQNLIISWNDQGKIAGLLLTPAASDTPATDRALPGNAVEYDVILFDGSVKQLCGKIIDPQTEDAPYVVFVHGSGPSDMDETIYGNKPFRDLAYDLAALGVGSIRFDKITYTHPELTYETVEQEYLDPVVEAVRVLRDQISETSRIYIIGHSQGGMLMPWLVRETNADGGIALAGAPVPLWEISYQQNLDTIALLPEDQHASLYALIKEERERAEALMELPEDELRNQTVFGFNALYLKHMSSLDQLAIAKALDKPMLFLWGESDVQVSEHHFSAWEAGLGESQLFEYITYPGLNHLFISAHPDENIQNTMSYYSIPASVDPRVAQDISEWIRSR